MSTPPDDIATLLAQHARLRTALEELRASIVALGELVPPLLVVQEVELAATLAMTEAKLWAGRAAQIKTSSGEVAGRETENSQGAFVN